jgi:hypothetical protein
MSTQTVYFNNPADITYLQGQVGSINSGLSSTLNVSSIAATGSIVSQGTIYSSNIASMQNQIKELQTKGDSGVVTTYSYLGGQPTDLNGNSSMQVDSTSSNHVYDNVLTSENLQYLQMDSAIQVPTNEQTTVAPCYFTTGSITYMFTLNDQYLLYTGPALTAYSGPSGPFPGSLSNRTTRREQFNMIQDLGYTGFGALGGYTGWNGIVPADAYPYLEAIRGRNWDSNTNAGTFATLAGQTLHSYGQLSQIVRLDTINNTVISRSMVSMCRQLNESGVSIPGDYIGCLFSRGPIVSLKNGLLATYIMTIGTYGIVVFDYNLNPKTYINLWAFNPITPGRTSNVDYNDLEMAARWTFGLVTAIPSMITPYTFTQQDLSGISYTNLLYPSSGAIDVFQGQSSVTFLYVSGVSQMQYVINDTWGMGVENGLISPLNVQKWSSARGEIVAFALINNSGNYSLVPVKKFDTCPDDYTTDDTLALDSFAVNPDTKGYYDLTTVIPLVDTTNVNSDTGFRNLNVNPVYQTEFTSSASSGTSAGLQDITISVVGMTGFMANYNQDVYGNTYKLVTGASDSYYINDYFGISSNVPGLASIPEGIFTSPDPGVKFYITPQKYYVDTAGTGYYLTSTGTYLTSGAQSDPSPRALARKNIMNNGFTSRWGFSRYDLSIQPVGTSANPLLQATMNPYPCGTWISGYNNLIRNLGGQFITAKVPFDEGEKFNINTVYYSTGYNLNSWIDKRTMTGAVAINGNLNQTNTLSTTVGPQPNRNYGNAITLSATGIKDFFTFTQGGLTDKPISVLLPGESYTDHHGASLTVPADQVVYAIKGTLMQGQLIKKTYTTAAVGKTLDAHEARALNFAAGGMYAAVSIFQDNQGQQHLLGGGSNLNYLPQSDRFLPSAHAAKQLITDIQNGDYPLSVSGMVKLGFLTSTGSLNISTTPVPGIFSDPMWKVGIADLSGKLLLDCSKRGVLKFMMDVSRYVKGEFAGQLFYHEGYTGAQTSTWPATNMAYFSPTPFTGPTLTGQEANECQDLINRIYTYRSRVLSNRSRRAACSLPFILNAKTLALEHICRGLYGDLDEWSTGEIGSSPDLFLKDTGFNRDYQGGFITAGSTHFVVSSKFSSMALPKNLMTSPQKIQLVSKGGRSNFASTYDGIYGQQITVTDKLNFSYNTTDKMWHHSNLGIAIQGEHSYIGKIGNKDVYCMVLNPQCNDNLTAYIWQMIPIKDGVKYNNYERVRFMYKTPDSKMYVGSSRINTTQVYTNYNTTLGNQLDLPGSYRLVYAYSVDQNGQFEFVWHTAIPIDNGLNWAGIYNGFGSGLNYFNLVNPSVGLGVSRINAAQAGNNAFNNNGIVVANDLIFVNLSFTTYILNAKTGEVVQTLRTTDYDFSETKIPGQSNVPPPLGAGTNNRREIASTSMVSYFNGNLYMLMGGRRSGGFTEIAAGRNIIKLNTKVRSPISSLNTTSLGCTTSTSLPVYFKHSDISNINSNQFCLLTTFSCLHEFKQVKCPWYVTDDVDFNALYANGITAIGLYLPNNVNLAPYQAPSIDYTTKFINGGSWYQATNRSFSSLVSAGAVLFLYAGQIPSQVAKQSPFPVNSEQEYECIRNRNQTTLLRLVPSSPYPATGIRSSPTFVNYLDYTAPLDPVASKIYNQSLGYTDVGPRPLPTPL